MRGSLRVLPGVESPRPFLIAGPCVLEEDGLVLRTAEALAAAARQRGMHLIFKASYLKDNRTSVDSFVGPGLEEGLRMLRRVRAETGLPVLTDVHAVDEVAAVAAVVDLLQVPAFLCRQTRLVQACARSGLPVNLKRGQFLGMTDMAQVADKARRAREGVELLLTERGTFFGYQDLVVDMRALAYLRTLGGRVVFDVTHALQHPGRGGCRSFARPLARAALGAGAEGLFVETHPDPSRARSDSSTQLPLEAMADLMDEWLRLGETVRELESRGPAGLTPGEGGRGDMPPIAPETGS
ncbi:MAG: 3-deoxy-8-phosphooctulonate synthase [Candidatus Eisenbacteria bacterium]